MKNQDQNYISVGSWMMMMFVTAIPLVGLIMVLVWAFTGENESRKNYFRAIIAWVVIVIVFTLLLLLAGVGPEFLKQLHSSTPHS